MRDLPCSEEQVLRDLARHEMKVIRDDGVHRHIRFKRPESGTYWFDLITWPGTLCIDGDCGTYVFRRIDDMFEFFRTDRKYALRKGCKLAINPGYWGEKLQAMARHGGYTEFDEERFNRVVMEYLVTWIRDNRRTTTKEQRRDLWDSVMIEVIGADSDSGGYRKQAAAHDFYHHIDGHARDFSFQDFWEHDVESYTFHFIWCCYAIAWGIQLYDETQTATQKEAA